MTSPRSFASSQTGSLGHAKSAHHRCESRAEGACRLRGGVERHCFCDHVGPPSAIGLRPQRRNQQVAWPESLRQPLERRFGNPCSPRLRSIADRLKVGLEGEPQDSLVKAGTSNLEALKYRLNRFQCYYRGAATLSRVTLKRNRVQPVMRPLPIRLIYEEKDHDEGSRKPRNRCQPSSGNRRSHCSR